MGIREVRTAASSTHSANRIVGRGPKRIHRAHVRRIPSYRPGGLFLHRDMRLHTNLLGIPQPIIEQLLEDHAIELGAQVRRGCAVTGFEQVGEGPTVVLAGEERPGRLRRLDRRTPAEPEPPPLPLVRRTHRQISPARFSPRFRCHRSLSACISRRRRPQRSRSGGQIVDIIWTAPMNPGWIHRRYLRIHRQRRVGARQQWIRTMIRQGEREA